jgi:hypothetical protein
MQNENLGVGIFGKPATDNVLCHATRSVSAHGGFRTIGVKDAHFEVYTLCTAIAIQRGHQHHTVGTDTETAVAKLYNLLFKSIAKIQRLTRFQQHEIVT